VRRAAVDALLLARAGPPASAAGLAADAVLPTMLAAAAARPAAAASDEPLLRVLCRSPAQVAAALELPWVSEVILDFLEVHGLKEAAAAVRAARRRLVVALPRILKPDEQRLWLFYLKLGADALLLRGAGALQQFMALGGPGAAVAGAEHAIPQLEGDFSLNAANVLAADALLGAGLSRLALTHDLNASQICGLAQELGPRVGGLEVVLHQHLAIFHTEFCVFCRFLSDGSSYKDCGHPCEKHDVRLRDGRGADHLVLADMGCRNTVFNSAAQTGLPYASDFLRAGLRVFRVELVDESPASVKALLTGYRDVLRGDRRAKDLWEELDEGGGDGHARGISTGSLATFRERAAETLRPSARR
jgi:collagenase-like PrtC family protease